MLTTEPFFTTLLAVEIENSLNLPWLFPSLLDSAREALPISVGYIGK